MTKKTKVSTKTKKKTAKTKSSTVRPPIVTIMGHVDHGKTTLLDAIAESNIQLKETGGMTQSIGAYQVTVKGKGKKEKEDRLITFIDTPGHEAFTAMRARGAKVTDIVLLVVAANDGVKPQTIEAIDHAKVAGVPIIVVINKIDLSGANPDKVREELTKYELISEDWGGQTVFVEVSAKNKTNLDELLDMILLVADMEEITVSEDEPFSAPIVESHLDSKRGPVSSIVVKSGTLKRGDNIYVGEIEGKVRSMVDEFRKTVKEAYPSKPVEITGLKGVPQVGNVVTKEKVIDKKEDDNNEDTKVSEEGRDLDSLFALEDQCPENELLLVVKAENQGALEAVIQSLEKIDQKEVTVKIIHKGIGLITESDILLAKVSCAYLFSFRVKPQNAILNIAKKENVSILYFDVIYKLIEEVESLIKGEEKAKKEQNVLAEGEVLAVFVRPKGDKIAGVKVTVGSFKKGQKVRVRRGEDIVFEGKIKTMRHIKEKVNQLKKNMEGGITLDMDFEYQEGDILEVYSSR